MGKSLSITESGKVRHRRNCDCAVCRDLRDETECDQCGGPVLVVEGELAYNVRCGHCGASATVVKAEYSSE